ncbi:HEPN domain-containing protein [Fibrisoma montanum]|uniref:HEPN domain-containing protein n=1 Tax=Fibrisoma montanum TaxID=2305895 RepID=A0A418M9A3_9BACT|nr:HEPN domain-containing protein [Fibrisoma montanum]RIV22656.1 HEPN domain-containing protein [Fibrisoma montanum]
MNKNVANYMSMAGDCLSDARMLLEKGSYRNAVGRAYYAYFDAVRALLASKSMAIKSHSAARSLFSQHFVKDGPFVAADAKELNSLFVLRQDAEYDPEELFDFDAVNKAIETAAEFLLQVEAYLRDNGFYKSIK